MRLTYSLGSAASDIYVESRDDTPLLLAKQAPGATTPARQFTWRDAAAGAQPASEADDAKELALFLGRGQERSAATVAMLSTPEPVLRVGTIAAFGLGVAALLTGWTKTGLVLVTAGVGDIGLRRLSTGYRTLRLNDPGVL